MSITSSAGILAALSQSGGMLTDGTTEITRHELLLAVTQTMAILDEQNLTDADCLALHCHNDLPSVIVLLALLASGRRFLLLLGQNVEIAATGDHFCRYHLAPNGQINITRGVVPAPKDSAIGLAENPCWRAHPPAGPPSFFVRTSGSTAAAKLVCHLHTRLLRAAGDCAARLGLGADDRVAIPVPIAHMFGLGAAFLPAILAGASIDVQPHANALRALARERQFNPNIVFMTPSFGDAMIRVRKRPRPYRFTVMAGDRLPASLFDQYEALHGCLVNLYGSTEMGVIAVGEPGAPAPVRRRFTGPPMPGVTIWQDGSGTAGDVLCIRHECGFVGYVDASGHTAGDPVSTEGLRSNDVGRLVDGLLEVQGRADDLVNRDGLLVGCSEVAEAVRKLPGIEDAVVLAGELGRRGRQLIAFCVMAPQMPWEPGALRKGCLGALLPRAIPDEFHLVAALPRLASGKIDRAALLRGYSNQTAHNPKGS